MPKNRHKSGQPALHILGEPPRPRPMTFPERRAWNKLVGDLLAARKLYQDDGPLIREWLQARADQYRGTGARREAGRKIALDIAAKFEARQPAPEASAGPSSESESTALAVSLEDFLIAVRAERIGFANQLVPGATVCLDVADVYEWPEGDPATVARLYCHQITQWQLPPSHLPPRPSPRHPTNP